MEAFFLVNQHRLLITSIPIAPSFGLISNVPFSIQFGFFALKNASLGIITVFSTASGSAPPL